MGKKNQLRKKSGERRTVAIVKNRTQEAPIRPFDGCPSNSEAIEKSRSELAAKPKRDLQREFDSWMKQSFGTGERGVLDHLMEQICCTAPNGEPHDYGNMDYQVSTLHGIAPRDQLEGLLAMQMLAVHSMAMECMKRAASKGQTGFGFELNITHATKLMRTFAAQTDALSRYRSKGEQKMTVEHVHVHKGGQAIVGQVSQNNNRNGSSNDETEK